MDEKLPDVDVLLKLAKENPQELEKLRVRLVENVIRNAPDKYARRLRGLQFRIDMERKLCKNPMHACIRLSEMMMDSFAELQSVLTQNVQGESREPIIRNSNSNIADILEFKKV